MNRVPFATVGLLLFIIPASAQTQLPPATPVPPATESAAKAAFGVLTGRWVRVQGGYVITINSVEADGRLDRSRLRAGLLWRDHGLGANRLSSFELGDGAMVGPLDGGHVAADLLEAIDCTTIGDHRVSAA